MTGETMLFVYFVWMVGAAATGLLFATIDIADGRSARPIDVLGTILLCALLWPLALVVVVLDRWKRGHWPWR